MWAMLVLKADIQQEIIPWAAICPDNSSTLHIPFADRVLLIRICWCSRAAAPRQQSSPWEGAGIDFVGYYNVVGADLTSSTVQCHLCTQCWICPCSGIHSLAGINDIWEWQFCVTTKAKQFGFVAGVVLQLTSICVLQHAWLRGITWNVKQNLLCLAEHYEKHQRSDYSSWWNFRHSTGKKMRLGQRQHHGLSSCRKDQEEWSAAAKWSSNNKCKTIQHKL